MNTNPTSIRVLIAEDSPVACELLVAILQSTPSLQVIGIARDGLEAVRLAKRLKPDVITMDVHMPDMDGLEATRRIMGEVPCPIVIISNGLNKQEATMTFSALEAGALSVLGKPTMHDPPEVYQALATHVELMSEVKVVRRWSKSTSSRNGANTDTKPLIAPRRGRSQAKLVVIAASTGGPGILAEILGKLPADFPVPILIVQHITSGFGEGLATWLNQQTSLEVRVAEQGDEPKIGQILIAPDDYHMVINNLGLIKLNQEETAHNLRPAADFLFHSAARVYGAAAIGVILSGMGSDGAQGLLAMRDTGAYTIAQDQSTCVVFGMPAVAIELGAVEQILPAPKIAAVLTDRCRVNS